MADIGTFTPEAARQLWQDYLRRSQLQPHLTQNYPQTRPVLDPVSRRRPAVIGTALTAPSSSLVAATDCTIYFLEMLADGTQELSVEPDTAYNDDPDVTASIGTYCRVEWVNSRWMIYYLGCTAQAALEAVIP